MASAELAQAQAALGNSQILGVHHFIGGTVAQHAMLVDAALMLEGIGAYHRLVGGGSMPLSPTTIREAR